MSRQFEIDKINKTYLDFMAGTKHDIDIGEYFIDKGIGTKDRFEIEDNTSLDHGMKVGTLDIKPLNYKEEK